MADKNSYEIAYDSDFIIDDPVELSTLCVFYDKVYLPFYMPNWLTISQMFFYQSSGVMPGIHWNFEDELYQFDNLNDGFDWEAYLRNPGNTNLEFLKNNSLLMWEKENKLYFDEGIIWRCEEFKPEFPRGIKLGLDWGQANDYHEFAEKFHARHKKFLVRKRTFGIALRSII